MACTACRARKIKVRESSLDLSETVGPIDPITNSLRFSQCNRDWENSQQKCHYCEIHDLSCERIVGYSTDPAMWRLAAIPEDEKEVGSGRATEQPRGHPDGSVTLSAPKVMPSDN